MNTFNKKSLYTAIAGLSALGVTGIAEAVHVNPDGLGQVLIYPYYTVAPDVGHSAVPDAQYNTLLSVVNSTASAKAVKVRFLESLNSREVLDFNLYLSHNDVWTAGIVPTADGAGVVTYDKSCTTPSLTAGTVYPFVASQYSGAKCGRRGQLARPHACVVVAADQRDLRVGALHAGSDCLRSPEIQRGRGHARHVAGRDHRAGQRQIAVGLDRHDVIENRAALPVEVEVGMIRQVHDRRRIGRRGIAEADRVLVAQPSS